MPSPNSAAIPHGANCGADRAAPATTNPAHPHPAGALAACGSLPPPIDLRAALASRPPEPDFVLPGLIAGTAGALVATGSTGKTMLALQLCAAVATALPPADGLFATDHRPARAVLLAAEESKQILQLRLHALVDYLKAGNPQQRIGEDDWLTHLVRNLELIPAVGRSALLVEQWRRTALVDDLKRWCEGARLLIVDPLRRLHDGDENDSAAMTVVVQVLESIAAATGCAVIAAHHTNRAAAWSGAGDQAHAARGSSALSDGIRWQANLVGMSAGEADRLTVDDRRQYVRLEIPKANYVPPFAGVWLRRRKGGVLSVADLDCKPRAKARREERHA